MKAVLDAVAERLLAGDELRIRIPEICQATGVNYGSVYHHFGSREGVIDAAYEALFCAHAEQEIARWEALVSTTRESFEAGLTALLDPVNHDVTRVGRAMTTRIVAAAETRPSLRDVVVASQTRVSDACARALAYGQRRGWLRTDASPEAMAGLVEAVAGRYGAQDLVEADARGQADVARLVWQFLLGPG